jgi:threonine dehydratase
MRSADRVPSLSEIAEARRELGERVRRTPVWRWQGRHLDQAISSSTEVHLKLELFQYAGTFKPRAALLNMLPLSPEQLARGVTAVSAGNHAMAVSFACRSLGSSAKVVMPRSANPHRVEECRALGAELVLVPDVHAAFDEVRRIEAEEGRAFIHPFEGYRTALGTATVAWELHQQVADLQAVVVPIGGGGLCAGVALATKLMCPDCLVFGVEPEGADTMHRSFAAGKPQGIDEVRTIADSLGAPHAEPYSFDLCRQFVDQLVLIDDRQIRRAMRLLYDEMKLVVEPAGAAATAALCGPLSDGLSGKRVGLIVCGSNIDPATFHRLTS